MKKDIANYTILLRREGKQDRLIARVPSDIDDFWSCNSEIEGFSISINLKKADMYTNFRIAGSHITGGTGHFVLKQEYKDGESWNFDGRVESDEIFRQSPHDREAWITNHISKQAVPVIACLQRSDNEVSVAGAVSSSPAFYDNYTSQGFFPSIGTLELSSGDTGTTPGKHPGSEILEKEYNLSSGQKLSTGKITAYDHYMETGKPHMFEGFLFAFPLKNGKDYEMRNYFRQQINLRIALRFCGNTGNNAFGDLAASTAYMNLRKNETGLSDFWVVPAVEYSNVQYGRDAFWISMLLPGQWDASCLENELAKADSYAEYILFTIIWAYRAESQGHFADRKKLEKCIAVASAKVRDSWFFGFDEEDGRLDFQFWGDVMAFDKDDVITYNQGLLAAALFMAEKMGLVLPENMNPRKAAENYRSLFNEELEFFPVSRKKNNLLTVDALAGDLLCQAYLEETLLEVNTVKKHYNAMMTRSLTPWGFKTICLPDGSYIPHEDYNAGDYIAQINRESDMPDGTYYRGGSYLLYDGIMLLDASVHGIEGAEEELAGRIRKELRMGGTTYECLNTVTGEPWKPNMGWNGGLFALINRFAAAGKLKPELFNFTYAE